MLSAATGVSSGSIDVGDGLNIGSYEVRPSRKVQERIHIWILKYDVHVKLYTPL